MQITSARSLDDGVLERDFVLGDVEGVLWTPAAASASAPAPLVLLGHPGGLAAMRGRLEGRARSSARLGFASAAIELPGKGTRSGLPVVDQARADLREALAAGALPGDDVIDRLILPLVDRAVPEWQALVDAALALPEVGGPVAVSGGVIAVGVRMAVVEPRVVAAGLFAGSYVPRTIIEEARRLRVPVHVLLQWDDEGNDRQRALDLFDAIGSQEKTLQANVGGHTGVPAHAGEDAARFFARHLRPGWGPRG
ncbi:alpha/beta hydrolase [Nocardioides sp. MH1]|uniref:alpha/beta hydrolase n=1 Tax=Nocardioides sp. MH1 TaxID=3242490 RepID=UPI003522B434